MIAYPSEIKVSKLIKHKYTNYSQEYVGIQIGDLTIYNTHLKAKPGFTADRLAQITELLSGITTNKVIVAGDFNESVMEVGTCIHFMINNGYTNCHPLFESITCKLRSELVCHKIDWIWCKGLNMISSNVEMKPLPILPNQFHPSDHICIDALFD